MKSRIASMKGGWDEFGEFWHSEPSMNFKRRTFQAKIQEAGLSGMLSHAMKSSEEQGIDR